MSLYNKEKKTNGTKKELLCSSSMKPELTNTHLRSQHDALCLIFRHPHDPMTTTCLLAPVRLQSCLDSSTSINLRTVQFHVLVKCIHNLQYSLQLQVAFWKKQLHRSGAIQVDSCLSSKHRKKTKQRAGRLGRGRHSDWCRHQNSGHEVVSLLLDDAVSKNLWRMLSMAPKIQLVYGFVRSKRLQCRLVRVLQETPFRSKSQARSRQHQPTNATSGDQQATETCATMQNGGNGPGFIRAAESQGKFVDNSRDERSRCSIPTQKRRHH